MAKKEPKQVRIRILPLHGIGGVGDAGDTAWMDEKEAKQYAKDGYLEILPDADEPVPSKAANEPKETQLELGEDEPGDETEADETEGEDLTIIPAEVKRK